MLSHPLIIFNRTKTLQAQLSFAVQQQSERVQG